MTSDVPLEIIYLIGIRNRLKIIVTSSPIKSKRKGKGTKAKEMRTNTFPKKNLITINDSKNIYKKESIIE